MSNPIDKDAITARLSKREPKPGEIKVRLECPSCGHADDLILGGVTREWAEVYCGLMDGTFPGYATPPGPDSLIGVCQTCGSKFKASIVD